MCLKFYSRSEIIDEIRKDVDEGFLTAGSGVVSNMKTVSIWVVRRLSCLETVCEYPIAVHDDMIDFCLRLGWGVGGGRSVDVADAAANVWNDYITELKKR